MHRKRQLDSLLAVTTVEPLNKNRARTRTRTRAKDTGWGQILSPCRVKLTFEINMNVVFCKLVFILKGSLSEIVPL